ncbi:hypothetical protein CAL29_01505 [Bordetella genomosp. 10]|uniref:ABC transporter domain-containing protein n=1 Tax=Bordetella genomosp. 10 TaxID=1416804 RepID=A0A261SIB3_9BORD|nr:ABC transporter ATP-binding protein [Bordetella genomosp. 10]OZI37134.1 hypothetical protein CAL29_01505 [Bordetella genomosp. 10]
MNILDIDNLHVCYRTARGTLHAVADVSLHVAPGETLGLVGESGCGKSSLGKAVMRLAHPDSGRIRILGQDITELKLRKLRPLRSQFQMVFQDPGGSLDPRQTVRRILSTPLRLTRPDLTRRAAAKRVDELLERVGLSSAVAERLPHEFSGGQRQRIAIARALAPEPKLVVCDEPVSALDVSLQAQILNLLGDLQSDLGVAYLFISHDLGVVQHLADRVAVMYLGRIVETGPRERIWRQPAHPYTRALIAAAPAITPAEERSAGARRGLLQGDLPDPYAPPQGCGFYTRCPIALPVCAVAPPAWTVLTQGHGVACHAVAAQGDPAASPSRVDGQVINFLRAPTQNLAPVRLETADLTHYSDD